MLDITSQVNKGIMFIRLEGDLTKNNFYKVSEEINYLLYKQGILAYVFNLKEVEKVEFELIESIENKLTEIFLRCGSVAFCGISKKLEAKIGKRKSNLFYIKEEYEVFNYIKI